VERDNKALDSDRLCFIIDEHLSNTECRQTNPFDMVAQKWSPEMKTVVDLGCGAGDSVDFFRSINSNVDWLGLDIACSPEVNMRHRSDAAFCSYDGTHIPLEANSVDLIFCRQVLEHVKKPQVLLQEIKRILKGGGLFIGSVSQMEPYHSYSIFNWTAWGVKTHFEEAGLRVKEIRPGIDGLTLMMWYLTNGRFFNRYFKQESPLNWMIEKVGLWRGRSSSYISAAKLQFSGHICFLAEKTDD